MILYCPRRCGQGTLEPGEPETHRCPECNAIMTDADPNVLLVPGPHGTKAEARAEVVIASTDTFTVMLVRAPPEDPRAVGIMLADLVRHYGDLYEREEGSQFDAATAIRLATAQLRDELTDPTDGDAPFIVPDTAES